MPSLAQGADDLGGLLPPEEVEEERTVVRRWSDVEGISGVEGELVLGFKHVQIGVVVERFFQDAV